MECRKPHADGRRIAVLDELGPLDEADRSGIVEYFFASDRHKSIVIGEAVEIAVDDVAVPLVVCVRRALDDHVGPEETMEEGSYEGGLAGAEIAVKVDAIAGDHGQFDLVHIVKRKEHGYKGIEKECMHDTDFFDISKYISKIR